MELSCLENCKRKLKQKKEHQKKGKYFAKFFGYPESVLASGYKLTRESVSICNFYY